MKRLLLSLVVALLFSCDQEEGLISEYSLSDGKTVDLGKVIAENQNTVLIFLSPECPLCQNYTTTIERLSKKFSSPNTEFYGILSGTYYPVSQMEGFLIRYELDLPVILDPNFTLANELEATITPEVFLLDSKGQTKYQGAIDNWAISLGQKRLKITNHYLEDALMARNNGEAIDIKKTEAVGCFIE